MKYRTLGRSGLKVSAVSLGSWLTIGNTVDQAGTARLVQQAVELGINLLDTADVYNRGEAEIALGLAIRGLRRQHLVLASKCFFPMSEDPNDRGLSRKHVVESLHASLRRLGTEYLDLYQCHRPDPEVPLAETAMAMDDLIRQGKVLYWGVSRWSGAQIVAAVQLCRAEGWHAPIANQPAYNLLDRGIEDEVLPRCAEAGVGQIVYSPLAQGALTGKYRAGSPPPDDSRAANPRINQFLEAQLTPERLARVARFAELCRRHGLAPAQVALAFCLRRPEVASVIVGASRAEQLVENAAAAELVVPPELLAALERDV
ncbi:MAG: aldo/keto reductase family protein [Planctomycetes bacterium]|nr:aldo/keto reductase family protein [Planctomycetota bacterium]